MTIMNELEPLDETFDRERPSDGLLSFYDRLRDRITTALARGGRAGTMAADTLLLVPDVFMLVVRLTLDRDVPKDTRRLLGGALLYFLVPIDLLPEAFTGVAGYADDLVLAAAVLSHAFGPELAARSARHWSGRGEVAQVLRDVVRSAESLLGANLWRRVQETLGRRGVKVPDAR